MNGSWYQNLRALTSVAKNTSVEVTLYLLYFSPHVSEISFCRNLGSAICHSGIISLNEIALPVNAQYRQDIRETSLALMS